MSEVRDDLPKGRTLELILYGDDLEGVLCFVHDDAGKSDETRILALPHWNTRRGTCGNKLRLNCREIRTSDYRAMKVSFD